MDSSNNQRLQDRLARQRGAGTHKVANAGFMIKPLLRLPAPVMPPPPKAPSPRVANPKPATPVQPLPRRSSRSRSRNNSPTTDTLALTTREIIGPSPYRDAATPSSGAPTQLESATKVSVSRASTRSTTRRSPAVAEVTPVARGKRMRQPSPDKFLTPQATGINGKLGRDLFSDEGAAEAETETEMETADDDIGGVTREVEEEEEEEVDTTLEVEELVDDETEDEGVVVEDATMEDATTELEVEEAEVDTGVVEDLTIEDVEENEPENEPEGPAIAIKSPENRNKRRKVIREELEELEELEPEPEDISFGLIEEPVVDAETPKPKRKQQITGKRPAPPHIPENEEDDDEIIEQTSEPELELEAEPSELGVSEEGQDSDPKPRKTSAKSHATTQSRPKPKPHRRAQRQDNPEPLATFAITVHRLGKSGNFVLPPGSQRPGFNPIDVINQASMDCIDKSFPKLKSNTERKAVENFKEELGLRFLELTDAVEHNIVLTARAKQAQKRKAQLMLELLKIKRDRENIAVKMDDVRKTHELATKSSEIQQYMSKTFEDISGTLERGKARQPEDGEEPGMDGLEALVRKVSVAVTGGNSSGTGLLATVVEFNRFLEKTERALSGRRRRD